jgi:hypothetical protein
MAQVVQARKARAKFICAQPSIHGLERYPAGTIAISDGKGKKLDSKTIIANIQPYQRSQIKFVIVFINSCMFYLFYSFL